MDGNIKPLVNRGEYCTNPWRSHSNKIKTNAVSEHAVNHFSFGKILNLHTIHEVQYTHARPKATIIKPGVNCITRLVNLQ